MVNGAGPGIEGSSDTHSSKAGLASYKRQIEILGLDYERVVSHRAAIMGALASGRKPQFKVQDTCRLDNGGILAADTYTDRYQAPHEGKPSRKQGFVAFIPAAGAASRYSAPLSTLIEALERGDLSQQKQEIKTLTEKGALQWPLPSHVAAVLADPSRLDALSQADKDRLSGALHMPKALMPCVMEGLSFLCMKAFEHEALPGLSGQIYVTPPSLQDEFQQELRACQLRFGSENTLPTAYLEQSPKLSTLRFNRDGSPYTEADGSLSLVPAGHGALAELIPAARRLSPQAASIFIRNIDNIMGSKLDVIKASQRFLDTHNIILSHIREIRTALAKSRLDDAANIAASLLAPLHATTSLLPQEEHILAHATSEPLRILAELQLRLFHSRIEQADVTSLQELYQRPVNTLGQVPNTGKDVGGTPCFIETQNGVEKVCIEVPHVSEDDKHDYLANPDKATHFNPVFAAAEIIDDPAYYARKNRDFWLLAEKSYRTRPVVYFETVLYELLGNSALSNCVFTEVPRLVFNPHKTLQDAVGRSKRDWF